MNEYDMKRVNKKSMDNMNQKIANEMNQIILNKMNVEKKERLLTKANDFLEQLTHYLFY